MHSKPTQKMVHALNAYQRSLRDTLWGRWCFCYRQSKTVQRSPLLYCPNHIALIHFLIPTDSGMAESQ